VGCNMMYEDKKGDSMAGEDSGPPKVEEVGRETE